MNAMSTVQTDKQTLQSWFDLTDLPQPNSVQWIQMFRSIPDEQLPGPTDYYIVAVLHYDEPVSSLGTTLKLSSYGDLYIEDDLLANWMPDNIVKAFTRTPEGYLIFNGDAYEPGAILLPPLNFGFMFFVDQDILIYGATN